MVPAHVATAAYVLTLWPQAFVREREDACGFDTSRLVDFYERVVFSAPATQVPALVLLFQFQFQM